MGIRYRDHGIPMASKRPDHRASLGVMDVNKLGCASTSKFFAVRGTRDGVDDEEEDGEDLFGENLEE